jgi:signal transduction histidine kinase
MSSLMPASIIVLLAISGSYLFAYRLYGQRFFLLMAYGWSANILYLSCEFIFHSFPVLVNILIEPSDLDRLLVPYILSLPSTFFFYYAYSHIPNKKPLIPASPLLVVFWITALVLAVLVAKFSVGVINLNLAFQLAVLPGIVLTIYVLSIIGLHYLTCHKKTLFQLLRGHHRPIEERAHLDHTNQYLDPGETSHDAVTHRTLFTSRLFLGGSLLIYATLQPTYLFKLELQGTWQLTCVFWIALVLKLSHSIGVPMLAYADFQDVMDTMRTRSLAEELGVLTASIEHDVRNPLANIRKLLVVLKDKYQYDKFLQNKTTQLEAQVRRIRAAVDVIPAMRETADFYKTKSMKWNLLDICNTSISYVKTGLPPNLIRIHLETTHKIIHINAYRDRLITALVNLLNNAIEACQMIGPQGTLPRQTISMHINSDTSRGVATILIRDPGVGIDSSIKDDILRPFFSTKNQEGRNRGIGLFTANRFINYHQGTLNFDSDGSTFTEVSVELPLAK